MTKKEAIQAMREGKKVAHRYFRSDEFIFMPQAGIYQFEDGVRMNETEFWGIRWEEEWEIDWEIVTTVTEKEYLKAKQVVEQYHQQLAKAGKEIKPLCPEWLTEDKRATIKKLWNTPNVNDANPRASAVKLIKGWAVDAGYTMTIKMSTDIIRDYCLQEN